MYFYKKILLLWIIVPFFTFPQSEDSVTISGNYSIKIDSIRIKGNDITKDYIILRELTFHNGDTLTNQAADFNRDRIYSLGIFNSVDVFPVKFKDYTCAFISVEESWYIYPIPFIELKDKDWDKISYGVDVEFKNFLGRNQRIRARASFGFDPAYYLLYSNPVLNREYNLFLNSEFSYRNVENRSKIADTLVGKEFKQKFITAQVGFGKRFNLYEFASIILGFNYVETPFYFPKISASNQRIDRIFYTGVGYTYDTRDLAQFPKTGVYGTGSVILKGLGINNINYQTLNTDIRTYREVFPDCFGKIRFTSRNLFGTSIPYFDYSFLGYGERVRGNSDKVREGLDYYLLSMELFTPIFKDIRFSMDWVPILPKELLTYRLALYAAVFADAGITREDGEVLSLNRTDKGYGLGVTFLILPYNILRIEYAFNEFRQAEVLIDLGISF